jgi:hypothetical protein
MMMTRTRKTNKEFWKSKARRYWNSEAAKNLHNRTG